jgi:hypothetical protein
LAKFQRNKERIGLIVDEYGDIQGLITLDDILEEIVGDFTTSMTPTPSDEIHPQPDGSFLVEGSASIRELNKEMDWHLPMDGPRTLNGAILEYLEEIPTQHQCQAGGLPYRDSRSGEQHGEDGEDHAAPVPGRFRVRGLKKAANGSLFVSLALVIRLQHQSGDELTEHLLQLVTVCQQILQRITIHHREEGVHRLLQGTLEQTDGDDMADRGAAVDPVQIAFQRPDHLPDIDLVGERAMRMPILAALGLQIAQFYQLVHHLHHVVAGYVVQGGYLGHARQFPSGRVAR